MTLFRIKDADIKKIPLDGNDGFDKFMSSNNFPEREQTSRIAAFFMFGSGLTTPVICINKQEDAVPRAYKTFPTIYIDADGNFIPKDEILIEIPDGYNNEGQKLEPTIPHEIVPADEAEKILSGIHGGGWGPMCDVYWVPSHGASLPHSFEMNDTVAPITSYKPSHAFILNKSNKLNKSIVWDFIISASGRNDAINKYINGVKKHIEDNNPGYYLNSSYSIDAPLIELTISLRKDTNGEPHPEPDLDGLIFGKNKIHKGEYDIDPDTRTKEGKNLQKLLNAIPPASNKNLSSLIFEAVSSTKIIVTVPESMKDIPSQLNSLTPMSLATYHWIKADMDDRAMGINPPLMPQEIHKELLKLHIVNNLDRHSAPTIKLERLNLS